MGLGVLTPTREGRFDMDLIAALLREREMYVTQGKADRIAQVDAELERLGHAPEKSTPAAPRKERAVRRSAPERAVPKD